MGKFQVFVLVSVVTCMIISTVQSVPVKDSSVESENSDKCKILCGSCGCTGYYCGDECLCECNSQDDGEAECVDTMKSNCKKLNLPFEVLIQGPNVNRMVRSLLYAHPSEDVCIQKSESNPKKRSTISIYKPDVIEQQDEILPVPTPHKDEGHDTYRVHHDDNPIQITVGQKLDSEVVPVETEPVPVETEPMNPDVQANENVEVVVNAPSDKESNDESEKLPLPVDDVDRVNIKRHIIDINQDIADIQADSDDSFLFKRDTEKEEGDKDVGAAAPQAPAAPAPLLPKVQEAIKNMRAQIPTSAEIKTAWEGVRTDLNDKINAAIADAQKRAEDLREKLTPPPSSPPPAHVKFHPFLRSENEDQDIGMAFAPLIPIVPAAPAAPAPVLPALTPLAIQTDISKTMAQFRANRKILQGEARDMINTLSNNRWLLPSPFVR